MMLILLILFAVAPIILAAIPNTESNQTFSIYNTGYDGFSIIRNDLETQLVGSANKYEPVNIISNLNVLNRFNGSGSGGEGFSRHPRPPDLPAGPAPCHRVLQTCRPHRTAPHPGQRSQRGFGPTAG